MIARMDVHEARRAAVALVRTSLIGDREGFGALLEGLDEDLVAALMVLTTLVELAHGSLLAGAGSEALAVLDELAAPYLAQERQDGAG